jgi:hypothetical protein
MPRNLLISFCFVVAGLFSSALLAQAELKDKGGHSPYEKLRAKAVAGEEVDYRALRLACLESDQCDARGSQEDHRALGAAMQQRDFKQAVLIAERMIEAGFCSIRAQMNASVAYAHLGNQEKANHHRRITDGLLQSILKTGDGKSAESAFEVIGTFEEQLILSLMGLPPFGNQSLLTNGKKPLDMIEVEDPKSKSKVRVYFDISAFFPSKAFRK